MDLIPYRKIVIKTHLTRWDAVECLRKAVFTHSPPLLYVRGPMDYYAEIGDDRFYAVRLLDYRANSFNPGLHGRFIQTPDGTEIHIQIYPAIISIIMVSPIIGIPLYLLAQQLLKSLGSGQAINVGSIIMLLLIPIFVYTLMGSFYSLEANRAEEFFNSTYQSEKVA